MTTQQHNSAHPGDQRAHRRSVVWGCPIHHTPAGTECPGCVAQGELITWDDIRRHPDRHHPSSRTATLASLTTDQRDTTAMTNDDNTSTHPITVHLRDAAEHLRLANHCTYGHRREVTELYDTFGALSALVDRLPQLLGHLWRNLNQTNAALYTTDNETPAQDTLNSAELSLADAMVHTEKLRSVINGAWSDIGHIRIHDTGTNPA